MVVQYFRNLMALKQQQSPQVGIKMPSYSQRFSVFAYLILLLAGTVITQDQDGLTTAVDLSATLSCTPSDSQQGSWKDATNGVTIYTMSPQGEPLKTDPAMANDKYLHYTAEVDESSKFNLVITSVNVADDGVFTCIDLLTQAQIIEYNVTVEVPPEERKVGCSSCTREDSTCNCECSASGALSPSMLSLEWKINDEVLSNQPSTEQTTDGGQVVYSSSAVVTVLKDDSVVTCTLTGFTNQDEMAGLYPERLQTHKTLSSPNCSVSVSGDNCPTVVLSCICDGYPPIPDSPESYTYYSRQGKEDTASDVLLNDTTQVVDPDSDIYFVCTGDNGLPFTTKSAAVPNPCGAAQPTGSTTTTEKDNGTGTGKGDKGLSAVIIVVIIVVVIAILIIVGGFTFWMVSKRGCCEKCTEEKNLATSDGNTNPSYTESAYDEVHKDTLAAKSDKTDGNGMQMSDAPEYAAVSKPLNSEPKPAPRSSQPPPTKSTEKQELQYADIDHSNRTPSNQIRQPAEAPTEYATVQSVIV